MEFQNWRSLSLKTKGAWILRHIFWTHCVTRPRPHSPVSFSFKAQFAGASHFNSFKTDNGTLSKHSSHAHLGKWPPVAVGFMVVIANESDLILLQLISWSNDDKKLGNYIEESWRKFPWFILDLFFSSNRGLEFVSDQIRASRCTYEQPSRNELTPKVHEG